MKTNTEWRLWGDKDPLQGVIPAPGRGRGDSNPWTDAEFYALGDDWLDFYEHWKRRGAPSGTVIEFGCGAGRITGPMARSFSRVIACDVAPGMLDYAKRRVSGHNIEWRLSDGLIPAQEDEADAVFSCLVLNHFESNAAQLAFFRDMYRVLKPGGAFMINIPLHEFPPCNRAFQKIARPMYRAFLVLTNIKASIWRFVMRFAGPPYMHGVSYEQGQLYADLVSIGFSNVEIETFPARATGGMLHTFAFGRK